MSERTYNIRISTEVRQLVAIHGFRLAESSVNVLFGESGIGKSLIALTISGLLDPNELRVTVNGMPYKMYLASREVSEIRQRGFFVFQEPSSHLNPIMTLQQQLNEGHIAGADGEELILRRLWKDNSSEQIERILEVRPKPYRPSGGEKQRVLAAMAFKKLATLGKESRGALFVFDEPTGNLDDRLRNEFLDLLMETFRRQRMSVLLITHDYSMVSRLTKEHKDIGKDILYRELVLDHSQLRLREFAPGEYLSWLATTKKPSPVADTRTEPILRLDSGVQVFGRSFTFEHEPNGGNEIPMTIHKGRITYLKAPSGTGKTTILKLMMGLIGPERMSMRILDSRFSEQTPQRMWQNNVWGKAMSMTFQHADEALNQNSDVKGVFGGLPSQLAKKDEAITRALSRFFQDEIPEDFLHQPVKYLSGGQKQRLNLLRSLILDTHILLLDEPLNGLDLTSSVKVFSGIEERLREGKGVLIVSHNEEIFDSMVAPEDVFYLKIS